MQMDAVCHIEWSYYDVKKIIRALRLHPWDMGVFDTLQTRLRIWSLEPCLNESWIFLHPLTPSQFWNYTPTIKGHMAPHKGVHNYLHS